MGYRPGSIRAIAAALGISRSQAHRILKGTASAGAIASYGRLAQALREGRADPAMAAAAEGGTAGGGAALA